MYVMGYIVFSPCLLTITLRFAYRVCQKQGSSGEVEGRDGISVRGDAEVGSVSSMVGRVVE